MTDCHDNQSHIKVLVFSIQATKREPTYGHQSPKGQVRIVVEGIRTNQSMEAAQSVIWVPGTHTCISARLVSSVLAQKRTRKILKMDNERCRMEQSWSSLSGLGKVLGGRARRSLNAWLLSGGFSQYKSWGMCKKTNRLGGMTKPSAFQTTYLQTLKWDNEDIFSVTQVKSMEWRSLIQVPLKCVAEHVGVQVVLDSQYQIKCRFSRFWRHG